MAGLFGGELLDTIGVPGIWFPFGIGVSRTQYIYAIVIPLLAFFIVRTLPAKSAYRQDDDTWSAIRRHPFLSGWNSDSFRAHQETDISPDSGRRLRKEP
jgi:hypothetical protein